jgi:hypothetical protein
VPARVPNSVKNAPCPVPLSRISRTLPSIELYVYPVDELLLLPSLREVGVAVIIEAIDDVFQFVDSIMACLVT